MLKHHADASANGALAVGDGGKLAVDKNLAGVGFVKAVQDRHQGRFARAIFADDAVDRAARHGDIDVAVGLHRTKSLRYAFKFDGIRQIGGGSCLPPPLFGVSH